MWLDYGTRSKSLTIDTRAFLKKEALVIICLKYFLDFTDQGIFLYQCCTYAVPIYALIHHLASDATCL